MTHQNLAIAKAAQGQSIEKSQKSMLCLHKLKGTAVGNQRQRIFLRAKTGETENKSSIGKLKGQKLIH